MSHVVAQQPAVSETDWIFMVLAVFVLVSGVVVVRHMSGHLAAAAAIGAAALLMSSSMGAVLRNVGMHAAGTTAPSISYFLQPFEVKAAAGRDGPDSLRLEIQFERPGSALDKLLERVATGELEFYLRVPAKCSAQRCEMSIAYPDGRTVTAVRGPFDFEMRFPADHPLVRDRSATLALVFNFSDDIILFARDIGTSSRVRADKLLHDGQEVPLSHDGLLFVRFVFLDKTGRPHSAFY